ncbi:hypothetical protein [Nocardioides sp. AX2bis]|uniref:hypothetical protein n=1 Tax=Nocardioides sp. AX2bis TaxID=2653157 RepID=UPI0012F22B57|nr:hypothetical protein [Nocardioides sp. AX2bis]VXC49871.1 hypothetical protein NOCARDAX2BIS_720003 [Nocardioides sp. AX2bis]
MDAHGSGRQPLLELDPVGSEGCFAVSTITGAYLLDLTGRRLQRTPVKVTSGPWSLLWTFDLDGHWLTLVDLVRCVVGEPMRARVMTGDPLLEQPLRSSPVQAIRRAPPSIGGARANAISP